MGCKACKIGAEEDDIFNSSVINNKLNNYNYNGLLTINDKQIWLDNLS